MERITIRHLQGLASQLNKMTGSPETGWQTTDGRNVASIGHYEISGAYGGWSLHRMVGDGGGVDDVFSCGHIPARDLYNRMRAYMEGIRTEQPGK